MGEIKPFGLALGLLGDLLVGFAIHKLLIAVGCTANFQTLGGCTDDITGAVPILIIGIFIVTGAVFAGGGSPAFLGLFFAIGAGSLIASFQAHDDFIPSFGKLFGGIFVAVSTLLAVMFGAMGAFTRGQRSKVQNLMASGARGTGTVVDVSDTGVTINENPRIKITMRIQPADGSPQFDVQKTETVSRVAVPRAGDSYPVVYDPKDPSQWAFGSAPQAVAPTVQTMFAQAAAPVAAAAPAPDSVAELERLGTLHASGALSDAEFAAAKAKLLGT